MDHLSSEALDWAITHIRRFGDTDLFPIPFEYEAIRHSWATLKNEILEINIETYEARSYQRFLVPKQYGGYRVAIQLDPIDTIIYTALAYEAANQIEQSRIPTERKIACSYRIEIDDQGALFRGNNGWDDFHLKSVELCNIGTYNYVVTADIADFYNQIGHHRIRNALEVAGVSSDRAKNIENLLMNFTRGQSQGIPTGPSASIILSEACLSDVDNFLLRKGYSHTRYVDDFRIFCRTLEEANKALHDLTEYLYTSHRLTLQGHKTIIFDVHEFMTRELVDPEEVEENSRTEKLKNLTAFLSNYTSTEQKISPDIDAVIRDNLVELFANCINQKPMHLGLAKYILRRATALRTGTLRTVVMDNINILMPLIREVTLYLKATTNQKFAKQICDQFIANCNESPQKFLPFTHYWLSEFLLSQKINQSMPEQINQILEQYIPTLGIRGYALHAKQNNYLDWVREKKETWQNNNPWDRRAIIWAGQALSHDEMNYWLQRVQNAGDLLDKAIANATLHIRNNP